VTFEQSGLDIATREAKLLRLVEGVKRPMNRTRVCRHEPAGVATAPVAPVIQRLLLEALPARVAS
jgi:hypothetical protein